MKIHYLVLSAVAAAVLSACGGGADIASPAAEVAMVSPVYQLSPVDPGEPDDVDTLEPRVLVNASPAATLDGSQVVTKAAAVPTVYTPAQIRLAYNMTPTPPLGVTLTAAQQAALGKGQTVYVIGAYHNPTAAADLKAFSSKFGLPQCTSITIPTTSGSLSAPGADCQFAVVYSTVNAGMKTAAPAVNTSWALETALDIQSVHALAPLARIVLIEATDSSVNSMLDAINVANKLGPGVISMSFAAPESSWVSNVESAFKATNMTYVAATGDSGVQSNWPAISPSVLAVGGTTLSWTNGSARTESAWKGSGGSYSSYFTAPAYQTNLTVGGVPTITAVKSKPRVAGDISFNADPYTGQYVAFTNPTTKAQNWYSVGGTSLATPQISGIIAVANATRALAGKTPIGKVQNTLYTNGYASYAAIKDVTLGTNGTCLYCSAKSGYDIPTGWGTPNIDNFVKALAAQ